MISYQFGEYNDTNKRHISRFYFKFVTENENENYNNNNDFVSHIELWHVKAKIFIIDVTVIYVKYHHF